MAGERQYVNYGNFENRAQEIDNHNTKLRGHLDNIEHLIESSNTSYLSNDAETIRTKIKGMEPRFEEYQKIIGNYATFLRNTAQDYEGVVKTNTANAEAFI